MDRSRPLARTRLARFAGAVALLALGGMASGGCQDQPDLLVPNRVLDRPMDMSFACVEFTCPATGDCEVKNVPLVNCTDDDGGSCRLLRPAASTTGTPTPETSQQLLAFIANSERNEVAVAKVCNGSLVDLDPDLPGYNFLPAGILPSSMSTGPSSCRVVAANAGTCDLTVVDAAGVGAVAFDVPVAREPSSLVGQVLPKRFDDATQSWVPLGTRVGDVVAVPTELSTAPLVPVTEVSSCASEVPLSAFVSFPSCDMIAEVDLNTGNLLQSFTFQAQPDGSVNVVDTGIAPSCAVDCPDQIPEGVDAPAPASPDRISLSALELLEDVVQPEGQGDEDPIEATPEDFRLYAGGLGSDLMFELRFDDAGRMLCSEDVACTPSDPGCDCAEVRRVELREAKGIERIRMTPRMSLGVGTDLNAGGETMFAYVVAGDGSTRVLERDLDGDDPVFATECDTQVEGTDAVVGDAVCAPVEVVPEGLKPLGRRHFAEGPGIRPPANVKINDWAFFRIETPAGVEEEEGQSNFPYPCYGSSEGESVVVGLGTASNGFVFWTAYPEVNFTRAVPVDDPAGILNTNLPVHALRQYGPLGLSDLPLAVDVPPGRALRNNADLSARLAPYLRLIDWGYVRSDDELLANGAAALDLNNADRLGGERSEDATSLEPDVAYVESAPKLVPRDYRSWQSGQWTVEWEGSIPNTGSATGVVRCTGCEEGGDPSVCGWERASCKSQVPGDSLLVDTGAQFCDNGVLPGDKVDIFGCLDDTDCGVGQRCLTAAGTTGVEGICIPETDFVNTDERARLRQVCAEFINDPCGTVEREYLVTRAFQDELWLQALDRPVRSHVRVSTDPDTGDSTVEEVEAQFICTERQPELECTSDEVCQNLLEGSDEDLGGTVFACIEGQCQRPCNGSDECTVRRLPGPECFGEFVRYNVKARNGFVVRGPGGSDFFTEHVTSDPVTGECQPLPPGQNVSELLRSRIPLGPDDASVGLPLCPNDQSVGALDPNPCLISSLRSDVTGRTPFHAIAYNEDPVTAVRFSNPVLSFTLDLSSLRDLARGVPDLEGVLWPQWAADFKRSRIPRNYRLDFALARGYQANASYPFFPDSLLPTFFPVRGLPGVGSNRLYIVDASGPGSSAGLRGQVVRASVCAPTEDGLQIDEAWNGVR